jgi:ubiquinone/menaquinone biosynthesis C-methylase UbiE
MSEMGTFAKRWMHSKRHARKCIERARSLLDHVDLDGSRDVLELGCGGGHVSRFMAIQHGLSVTGTDVDPYMIQGAEGRLEGVDGLRLMVADATDLPFEDDSFDMALSFNVLHHIDNWPSAITEVGRVLRSGGHYLLGDYAHSRLPEGSPSPDGGASGAYTAELLLDHARTVGFEVEWRSPPKGLLHKYYSFVLRKQ